MRTVVSSSPNTVAVAEVNESKIYIFIGSGKTVYMAKYVGGESRGAKKFAFVCLDNSCGWANGSQPSLSILIADSLRYGPIYEFDTLAEVATFILGNGYGR